MLSLAWKMARSANRESSAATALVWTLVAALALALGLPLLSILGKSVLTTDGDFAGLANFASVLDSPGLMRAAGNSLLLATTVSALVVPLAFAFAWALRRSRAWGRGLFRQIALAPLLAPSLMPAISLVYLFGNQGLLKDWLHGGSVYGFWGVALGEAFYTFPYALMILSVALSAADARLYEAARTLGAGPLRQFLTVTLPGARYGLVSSALVVFTVVITDFGVPKVVGGDCNVLAVEAYKQVVGQQNFPRGGVVGLMLLLPAVLSFFIERAMARRQQAALTARAVWYVPAPDWRRDAAATALLALISLPLLALLGMGVAASFIQYWPYDLSFTLAHYRFDDVDGGGWGSYFNSLGMAAATAVIGSALVFLGAYACDKLKAAPLGRALLRFLAMLPMAVPGLVLGLGYVFFFNHPANPLNALYGGMALMVACTIAHFYTTAHLTVAASLGQLDGEFEAVAASLKVPFWTTLRRVTLPVCLPALLDVARFLFVSAMTTLSALIFIISPGKGLAAVAIVTMDDAGDTAAAAAMATLIALTSGAAWLLALGLERALARRHQRWRRGGEAKR
ncbi:putative 2-aminoethylphosphonate ABC transporter permease subunit [Chromobacterium sp. ATCC 53434]|uniref:putative 2-aminoethylphosphonate ABC transporter permease subunit n=1 Tax=Chromobacterium sp. (strain ATCC 53434 / SC 14030) TaxID=2059672 RepID=UPI000C781CEF|nr:putative 2-aminoethylphosphonate ABC transporter permease subunit [Chromobacterium sp. ATCC 53434]AUH51682.1 putative 2-aminoethylphosphonate ABC transporter permease subunit [Chromobacterium sp. ATCC 53434]